MTAVAAPPVPPPVAPLPTHRLEDTAAIVEAIHDDGFALIPGVLSADEIAAARAALDRLQPFGKDAGPGGKWAMNEHYKCVFNRERLWLSYVDRPGVVDIAYGLWTETCHVLGMSAWRSHPGYDGWRVHVDRLFAGEFLPPEVFADPRFRLPVYICTAHYYLTDQPLECCPTWIIPGSHKSGRRPARDEAVWNGRPMQPVLCKAGDVLFFRSEVWHSGSRNTSTDIRYLLQVHYAQRDIAQKFSPWPWQLNPEILATATRRQRRLLGDHPEGAYG